MINENTRLIDITLGDFMEFLNKQKPAEQTKDYTGQDGVEYVYGIAGLAALYGCSKRAAHVLKESGKIDEAITQEGRKIVVNATLALKLHTKKK